MTLREQKLRKDFFNRTAQKILVRLSKGKSEEFNDLVSKIYKQNHPKKFLRKLDYLVFKEKVEKAFEKIKKQEKQLPQRKLAISNRKPQQVVPLVERKKPWELSFAFH